MPAGGRLSAGIVGAFFVAPRCCAPTQCIGATAAATRKAKVIVNCFISPPIGTGLGAHPHSSRANATGQLDQLRCNNKQIIHLSFHYCSGRYFDCPSRGNSVSLHPDSVGGGRWAVGGQITVHRSPSTGEQLQYLSWLGMAAELRFLEDGRPIPKHLESPPARRNELHLFIGKGISDLRRQTDGAWLVVSNRAVFDRDHRRFVALPLIIYLLSCEPSVATRCGCSLMSSAFQLASALSTIA